MIRFKAYLENTKQPPKYRSHFLFHRKLVMRYRD